MTSHHQRSSRSLISHPHSSNDVLVSADVEAQKAWYSKTQFAELWTWLTSKNPMLTAMVVSGSLVVLIISIGYLRDDRNARKAATEKKED